MNVDDNWRSEWIDALVRENLLHRELVAHRHNPDDLVPVIKLPEEEVPYSPEMDVVVQVSEEHVEEMITRIVVSVEQYHNDRGKRMQKGCLMESFWLAWNSFEKQAYLQGTRLDKMELCCLEYFLKWLFNMGNPQKSYPMVDSGALEFHPK